MYTWNSNHENDDGGENDNENDNENENMYNNSDVKFRDIKVGNIYSVKPRAEDTLNEYDWKNVLVKVLEKHIERRYEYLDISRDITVEIISDYNDPKYNKVFPPKITRLHYDLYNFMLPDKADILFVKKRHKLDTYKQMLRNLRTTKKIKVLPNNSKRLIASYLTGLNTQINSTHKMSLKTQENTLKKQINSLEKNLYSNKPMELLRLSDDHEPNIEISTDNQRGGRRKTRRRSTK